MRILLRHYILVASLLTIMLSFLFYGRKQDLYAKLLMLGILFACLSFVLILMKDALKPKLFWAIVVVIAAAVQYFSESWLIGESFQILLTKHKTLFTDAVNIMQSKPAGIVFWGSKEDSTLGKFSRDEILVLSNLQTKAGLTYISRNENCIFFETYGFLDSRGGISYFYNREADSRYKKIKGQWFY